MEKYRLQVTTQENKSEQTILFTRKWGMKKIRALLKDKNTSRREIHAVSKK
jgi:hypothetical protein